MTRNPWAPAIRAAIKASGRKIDDDLDKVEGLSRSALYSWRNPNGYKPTPDKLPILAQALGVSPESLTRQVDASGNTPHPPQQHQPLTPVQRVHAQGVEDQRTWLWEYTVSVMRAIVEQADLLGAAPPRNSPADFAARASTQAMQYLMTAPPAAPEPSIDAQRRELEDRLANAPVPTAAEAARDARARETVMKHAAKQSKGKGGVSSPRKRA